MNGLSEINWAETKEWIREAALYTIVSSLEFISSVIRNALENFEQETIFTAVWMESAGQMWN